MYAGIDSSTQSVKVLVVDDGQVVRSGRASHPSGTQVPPDAWWVALKQAIEEAGGIEDCDAVSIAGQQHGMILLDSGGNVLRDAMLWNDTSSAQAASDLIEELGRDWWVHACGSAPVASLTVTKLRWIADNEPETARKIAAVCLPHDWLSWKLRGSEDINDLVTDRSDASGTGYVDAKTAQYRWDILAHALRISEVEAKQIVLPRIAEPFESIGTVKPEFGTAVVGPGLGDNAAAALGLGLRPGEASISLGTSGVVAAVSKSPVMDPNAEVTGFMDGTGNWLPLACTLNGARIIDNVKDLLGVGYEDFDSLAMSGDSKGLTLVPFFEGERTPNLPHATAALHGMTSNNMDPKCFARAAFEGLACLLRGALEAVLRCGVPVKRAVLIGGGAKSRAAQTILPGILGIPVDLADPGEYVALGAAWQAAKVRDPQLGPWPVERSELMGPVGADRSRAEAIWQRYTEVASDIFQSGEDSQ